MYEGSYVRWGIWPKGHELAGQVHIELLEKDFSSLSLLGLIKALMAIRDLMLLNETEND
jgi:hypothetical protein